MAQRVIRYCFGINMKLPIKLRIKLYHKKLFCDPSYSLRTDFLKKANELYLQKTGRIIGCQSKNHTECKGELWTCERCQKRICWEEGSTDSIELCDDCWVDVRGKEAIWQGA